MKIPRMTVITLGMADLARATAFYREIFSIPPSRNTKVSPSFRCLACGFRSTRWINSPRISRRMSRCPHRIHFAASPSLTTARSKEEIVSIFARAAEAGAHIAKTPQDTFWGGHSGYFSDPDGNYWEVAWGPMFEFTEHGDLRFKA